MSAVNRNIIGNLSIPLSGGSISTGPAELDLITTTGSRFVMLEFPSKFVSSSEGGLCQNLVLEWTRDPAMVTNPLASSSAYFAVTSSVISCNSASLSPMTASKAWVQYIDSLYDAAGTDGFYYMRGYQRTIAGYNPQIYSNVVSIQTRPASICGATPVSENSVAYDVDGFISGSKWFNTPGISGVQNYSVASMNASTDLTLVKAGGPNFDAIKTNGANLAMTLPAIGGTANSLIGVAVVQGSVRIPTSQGELFVSAVSSSSSGSVVFKNVSLQSGINTINTIIKIGYVNVPGLEQYIFVENDATTLIPGSAPALTLPTNTTITTSADCIMRVFFAGPDGGKNYSPTVYHCKYGPSGVNGYVG
jgi:F0F1-type ATP synthase membrane subunit c/vacuolar-type H+-ATPase subunit K